MKRIFKYPLEVVDYQEILMPIGAEILTLQTQYTRAFNPLATDYDAVPCIWAIVEEYEEIETVTFRTIGTGHYIHDESEVKDYIGTYQLNQGQLIFHVFKL